MGAWSLPTISLLLSPYTHSPASQQDFLRISVDMIDPFLMESLSKEPPLLFFLPSVPCCYLVSFLFLFSFLVLSLFFFFLRFFGLLLAQRQSVGLSGTWGAPYVVSRGGQRRKRHRPVCYTGLQFSISILCYQPNCTTTLCVLYTSPCGRYRALESPVLFFCFLFICCHIETVDALLICNNAMQKKSRLQRQTYESNILAHTMTSRRQ